MNNIKKQTKDRKKNTERTVFWLKTRSEQLYRNEFFYQKYITFFIGLTKFARNIFIEYV